MMVMLINLSNYLICAPNGYKNFLSFDRGDACTLANELKIPGVYT